MTWPRIVWVVSGIVLALWLQGRIYSRPRAPLPLEDYIGRVYLGALLFVLGAFVGGLFFHGCQ